MQAFLLQDEINFDYEKVLQPKNVELILEWGKKLKKKRPVHITIENLYANWTSKRLPPTLHNVSTVVEGGKLCAIVGHVGSGKTALLNVLLKELPVGAGIVCMRQFPGIEMRHVHSQTAFIVDNPKLRISYASQDTWLFTATVRDNILFGQNFDQQRYQKVKLPLF